MAVSADTLQSVRAVLAGALPGPVGDVDIFPAEQSVYRGFLVLSADRMWFVKDRFGTLEYAGETPFSSLTDISLHKGFMGHEFRAKAGGREVRFTRIDEADAARLEAAVSSTAVPDHMSEPVPAPAAAPLVQPASHMEALDREADRRRAELEAEMDEQRRQAEAARRRAVDAAEKAKADAERALARAREERDGLDREAQREAHQQVIDTIGRHLRQIGGTFSPSPAPRAERIPLSRIQPDLDRQRDAVLAGKASDKGVGPSSTGSAMFGAIASRRRDILDRQEDEREDGPDTATGSGLADTAGAASRAAPDRQTLIRLISHTGEVTKAGQELIRQIQGLDGDHWPSPVEAADLLLAFDRDDRANPNLFLDSPFGWRLARPMVELIDNRDNPSWARELAADALGALRSKRFIAFLAYHATREKDPQVAAAFYEALVKYPNEASVRSLLKVVDHMGLPYSDLALTALESSAWAPLVSLLAEEAGMVKDARSQRKAAACARILRVPPIESSSRDEEEVLAFSFTRFWDEHGSDDPVDLLRASVEANIMSLQKGDEHVLEAVNDNLEILTKDFESEKYSLGKMLGRDDLGRLQWWATVRSRGPGAWLSSTYLEGLKVPVKRSAKAATRKSGSGKKGGKGSRTEKLFNIKGAGIRALLAGLAGGALMAGFHAIMPLPHPVPGWAAYLVVMALAACLGPVMMGKFRWALPMMMWGAAGAVPGVLAGATGYNWMMGSLVPAIYWAAVGGGLFATRRSEAGFVSGAILGGAVFLGYNWVLRGVIVATTGFFPADYGVFCVIFWLVNYLPHVRSDD